MLIFVPQHRYDSPVVLDGLKNQQFNEEVLVDPKRQSASLSEQVFTLKSVSMQLKNAFNGQDVEWIDSEEIFDSSSGSGLFPDSDSLDNENRNNEGSGLFGPSLTSGTNAVDVSTIISDSDVIPVFNNRNRMDTSDSTSTQFVTSPTAFSTTIQFNRTNEVTMSTIFVSTTYSIISDGGAVGTVDVANVNNENVTDTSGGAVLRYDKMSLNQAVATYLLPTVVIWVGGSFNDWFHSIASRT